MYSCLTQCAQIKLWLYCKPEDYIVDNENEYNLIILVGMLSNHLSQTMNLKASYCLNKKPSSLHKCIY